MSDLPSGPNKQNAAKQTEDPPIPTHLESYANYKEPYPKRFKRYCNRNLNRVLVGVELSFALALVVITAWYTHYAGGQLTVMRGQLGEIIKQYPELQESADAAFKNAQVAAAGLRADLVPVWGNIKGLGKQFPGREKYGGKMSIVLVFKNFGKSDPSASSVSINWVLIANDGRPIPTNLGCSWNEHVLVLSHPQKDFGKPKTDSADIHEPTKVEQAYGTTVLMILPQSQEVDDLYAIDKPPKILVVYGCVEFVDIMGTHCSTYAARIVTDPLDPHKPKYGAGFQAENVSPRRTTEDVSCSEKKR